MANLYSPADIKLMVNRAMKDARKYFEDYKNLHEEMKALNDGVLQPTEQTAKKVIDLNAVCDQLTMELLNEPLPTRMMTPIKQMRSSLKDEIAKFWRKYDEEPAVPAVPIKLAAYPSPF